MRFLEILAFFAKPVSVNPLGGAGRKVCTLTNTSFLQGEDVLSGSVPMVTKEPAHFHFNWAALTETLGFEPVKETLGFEAVKEESENPVQIM